jgi:hypothetical protein
MPLHDWTGRPGWDGVFVLWLTELLRWIKPRLPSGYRVYIRRPPMGAFDVLPEALGGPDPDELTANAIHVERQGRVVSAVELASPRTKDRTEARTAYLAQYVGYLTGSIHLLLVDVHPQPPEFSFADEIGRELKVSQPPLPAPFAVGYRVGEGASTDGHLLAVWRRPLTAEAPLPLMALPLSEETSVPVDLEQTYMRAAADAYLA